MSAATSRRNPGAPLDPFAGEANTVFPDAVATPVPPFATLTMLAPSLIAVTMSAPAVVAMPGPGYDPVRSPLAVPVGGAPPAVVANVAVAAFPVVFWLSVG